MPKITVTVEVKYEKGDIYNMTTEEQNELIRAVCTPQQVMRAKGQLFPRDYLLARADIAASFDPLTDL